MDRKTISNLASFRFLVFALLFNCVLVFVNIYLTDSDTINYTQPRHRVSRQASVTNCARPSHDCSQTACCKSAVTQITCRSKPDHSKKCVVDGIKMPGRGVRKIPSLPKPITSTTTEKLLIKLKDSKYANTKINTTKIPCAKKNHNCRVLKCCDKRGKKGKIICRVKTKTCGYLIKKIITTEKSKPMFKRVKSKPTFKTKPVVTAKSVGTTTLHPITITGPDISAENTLKMLPSLKTTALVSINEPEITTIEAKIKEIQISITPKPVSEQMTELEMIAEQSTIKYISEESTVSETSIKSIPTEPELDHFKLSEPTKGSKTIKTKTKVSKTIEKLIPKVILSTILPKQKVIITTVPIKLIKTTSHMNVPKTLKPTSTTPELTVKTTLPPTLLPTITTKSLISSSSITTFIPQIIAFQTTETVAETPETIIENSILDTTTKPESVEQTTSAPSTLVPNVTPKPKISMDQNKITLAVTSTTKSINIIIPTTIKTSFLTNITNFNNLLTIRPTKLTPITTKRTPIKNTNIKISTTIQPTKIIPITLNLTPNSSALPKKTLAPTSATEPITTLTTFISEIPTTLMPQTTIVTKLAIQTTILTTTIPTTLTAQRSTQKTVESISIKSTSMSTQLTTLAPAIQINQTLPADPTLLVTETAILNLTSQKTQTNGSPNEPTATQALQDNNFLSETSTLSVLNATSNDTILLNETTSATINPSESTDLTTVESTTSLISEEGSVVVQPHLNNAKQVVDK